jgi:hypothetical protein
MLESVGVLGKHKLESWPVLVPVVENAWISVCFGQISPLLTILATSLALLLIEIAIRW